MHGLRQVGTRQKGEAISQKCRVVNRFWGGFAAAGAHEPMHGFIDLELPSMVERKFTC